MNAVARPKASFKIYHIFMTSFELFGTAFAIYQANQAPEPYYKVNLI